MRILVVEDEIKVANFIARGLRELGFVVDVETDGSRGERLAREGQYDLLILDVMLPGRDGYQILSGVRQA